MAATDVLEKKVVLFSIQTRCIFILMQVFFNNLIPDHDADVFNPPSNARPTHSNGPMDYVVEIILSGLNRWDSLYFIHIAENGYIYQNSLAFFPLFPCLVRVFANTLCFPLQFLLTYRNVLLISALLCNVTLCALSVKFLFRLGRNVLKSTDIAYKSCLLFSINPASIFMTAPYSEILYFFLVVYGLLCLESSNKITAVLMFAISSLARSNGLLNFGFILYESLNFLAMTLKSFFSGMSVTKNNSRKISMTFRICTFFNILVAQVVYLFIAFVLFLLPFILYQIYYVNELFCKRSKSAFDLIPDYLIAYGQERDYQIKGNSVSPWCNLTIPLSYSYVQSSHWGVGFLKYYEFKQIPNFLLALPVTILSLYCVWSYYKWNKKTCWTLGVETQTMVMKKNDEDRRCVWNNPQLLPYVVHALMLTIFGWMFIHIQVLTRMLFSSTPLLYWFAAYCTTNKTKTQVAIRNEYDVIKSSEDISIVETEDNLKHSVMNILLDQILNFKQQTLVTKLILGYFLLYVVVGSLMFCNFLPWT